MRPGLSVVLTGALLPLGGMILLGLLRGQDRHGFGFMAMILFGGASLPLCLATSAATIWLRRKQPNRPT